METTILIVDDHGVFRMGLKLLLAEEEGMRVVGEAGDGQAAIEQVRDLAPEVVIMDISMPDMDGIKATRQILSESPETKIIALSIHGGKDYVEEMLRAGAHGYILKESALEDLVPGIRAVQRGDLFLSDAVEEIVVSQYVEGLAQHAPQSDGPSYSPLLMTKLHPPRLTRNAIVRSRLLEHLHEGLERPLTLVSAPAGYGKSTLVSQWLEVSDRPGIWLSLDERDNDLHLFLTYLAAAVHTQFAEALLETEALLQAPTLLPVHVLAKTLANDLAHLPERFILVLDDYHRIEEPAIHELLGELLRHPPRTMHLVLASRTDPAFDLLQMRAYRQMGEVRAQALGFTVEETAAFLESAVGSAVETSIAEEVARKTEGWVTGLHLVTLSVSDSADLADLSTILPGERQTLDYLASEALSRQPREVQAWLLKSSILDRFCASLAEAVCAPSDNGAASRLNGDEFMRWLSESNLFVILLDNQGQWARYHHLFQELLQNKLQNALDDKEISDLHIRASRWFNAKNSTKEAIRHAVEAGDVVGAARMVEDNRHAILEHHRWYILKNWLSILPESIKQQRPALLMAQLEVFQCEQNLTAALSTLEKLEQILDEDQAHDTVWGEYYYFKGYLNYFGGRGSQALAYQERALVRIPEINNYYRGEAELHLALTLHMTGNKERALAELTNWLKTGAPNTLQYWAGLCYINMLEGDLHSALHPAQQCVAIASENKNLFVLGWFIYMKACINLAQHDQEQAISNLEQLVGNPFQMQTRIAVDSFCTLAFLHQFNGQTERVVDMMSQLQAFVRETNDQANEIVAASCQARLSLMDGDVQDALQWLQTADLAADEEIMLWWMEIPRITGCRVLVAEGSPENLQRAIEDLQKYQEENQALNNSFQVIVMLPLLALAYHKLGRNDQALEVLEEALDQGRAGGWIWPFVELGAPVAGLLRQLKMQGLDSDLSAYSDQILAAFPASAPSRQNDRQDDLTDRELQVLRLLATTLSTQEITDELVVSVNTVRMHTKNIYSKLDVHSRIEAVERARELDII